jgi:pimeloyl-ACP methyl ester carboxylesterase
MRSEGSGEAVVFLHGAMLHSGLWIGQLAHLGRKYRCIAYDLRGHGFTGRTGQPRYSAESYADDLADLLDVLDLSQANICGLSLGGMIAQIFAARYPEKVSRLILCDTVLSTTLFFSDRLLNSLLGLIAPPLIRFLPPARFRSITRQLRSLTGNDRWISLSEEGRAFVQEATQMVETAETLKILRAVQDFRGTNLRQVRQPVLLLHGAMESPLLQRQSRFFQEQLLDVRLSTIPNASHLSNLDNPALFNRELERFLEITAGSDLANQGFRVIGGSAGFSP